VARFLSVPQVKRFYDRFGRLQDAQVLFEGGALRDVAARGRFENARAVLEFGCGAGTFARRLFERGLPPGCRYLGIDVSQTMVRLTRRRLAPWPDRAEVLLTDGALRLPLPDAAFDRFVANYVFDLLSPADTTLLLQEARRLLEPEGLLCVASLAAGATPLARLLARAWRRLQSFRPALVGGCRPIHFPPSLPPELWRLEYSRVVTQCGLSSEVVIAARR
jgi:ubiquinone/menaquinone biosynthesis C-methylase UbiE